MESWSSDETRASEPTEAQATAGATEERGRCAEHPERAADATCDRCGDNICAECRHVATAKAFCTPCLAREGGAPAVVPWEDKNRAFAFRVYESVDGLILRPSRVMARLPPGKRAPAYWLLALLLFAPLTIIGTLIQGTGGLGSALFGLLVVVPAAWVGGLAAAITARVVGVRDSMDHVGRAAAYAWIGAVGPAVLTLSVMWIGQAAGHGPDDVSTLTIWLAFLVSCVLIGRAMVVFARGALKLQRPAAYAVALASITPLWLPVVALAIMRVLG